MKIVTFDLRPGSLNIVMSCGEWLPIDHRPPLPRIETAPRYTPAPEMIPPHLQVQIEHAQRMDRLAVGERIWRHVVDVATGG